ncbi:MAG: penicillin-binding protein [Pseudonocardiales bacterium]|nr:penicillin-binding protein [Pseudonocardiales bacterium]
MNKPIRKVSIALAVLFLALFVNLNFVQVVKGSDYRNDPQNRRVLLNEYSSPRGQIVVQPGTPVAESKKTSDELKYLRNYPQGPIFAPVTGYYSFTYGATGIESAENDILSGDSPELFTTKLTNLLTGRDPRGGSVALTISRQAQVAAYNAMRGADGQLRRGAVVALDPMTGAILAMVSTPSFDPNKLSSHNSTEITRAYKQYNSMKSQPLLNRAISQNYPAGSIFKIIDSAAALQLSSGNGEAITPDTRIPAADGYRPFDPKDTSACPAALNTACVENFGGETCDNGKDATLDFAFAKSCNTAFAQLAVDRIGGTDLAKQAAAFGFDLPYQGTRPPDFCDPPAMTIPLSVCRSSVGSQSDMADPAALAQTAFGQRDVRITPIQAAMLSSAVAFDGLLMKPYLVAKELRPNLDTLNQTDPVQLGQVIDPTVDQDLIRMMEDVVYSDEGTGHLARIQDLEPQVRIGGKTGTADVGATSASSNEPDAWFTGFALLNGQPRIAVAVIIENGGVAGDESAGGLAAAPVAQKVMSAYLRTLSGVG